jgi:hypothetical protein
VGRGRDVADARSREHRRAAAAIGVEIVTDQKGIPVQRSANLTAVPAEWFSTLGLRAGMHVHDGNGNAPEHVVAAVEPFGEPGRWDVSFRDTAEHVVCGARHSWLVTG